MMFVLSLHASHVFVFVFGIDGTFRSSKNVDSIHVEDYNWLLVTEEQYNTGYTNLSPSVQADLRDQVLRQMLVVPSRRSGLVEQYFIIHINDAKAGGTNQISAESLMIWMCEQ
jgi:hypothetical protein